MLDLDVFVVVFVVFVLCYHSLYLIVLPCFCWLRPYTLENTGSRPISEVKLVMAQSVLWWGTTWEYCVS